MGEHMGHGDMDGMMGMTTAMGGGHDGHDMHSMDMGSTHDPSHGGGGEHDMMMNMYFYLGTNVTILFQQWAVTSTGAFVAAWFGVFITAMLYEGLKVGRESLLRRSVINVRSHTMPISNKGSQTMLTETHQAGQTKFLSWAHLLQTLLHVVQVTISYFLMLIFMTYNAYLCIAIALGAGVGYFIFGWKKAIVVDINEHCH